MESCINGRRVRRTSVRIAPDGPVVTVFEVADADAWLGAAARDPDLDPYAGILWPAAVAVATELAGDVAPGERVLDLGAGTGLCALAAARLGARAIALDHDPFALELVRHAARLQALDVETRRFDLAGAEPLPPADLVLLADLLYEPALARAAARRIAEVVRRGSRVLIGDPGRFSRDVFLSALADNDLHPVFTDVHVHLPGGERGGIVGVARLGPAAPRR